MIGFCSALVLTAQACGSRTDPLLPDSGPDIRSVDSSIDVPLDAPRCVPGEPVDVLFVIDNSRSMAEEQTALAAEVPRLMQALVRPPDLDGDGLPDWNPVQNLQVGVVTTDLGTGDFAVGSCERPRGSDGQLRNVGNPARFECLRAFPRFLSYNGGDETRLVDQLGCLIEVGTDGCGQEQPLDAILKALTPASSDIRFARDTTGHGDGVNSGFLRPGSFLVIVIVTDEDDCSVSDIDLFAPDNPRYPEHPNLRCYLHPEALFGVDRYVDGLLALRGGDRSRIAVSLITGVPPDLVSASTDPDFEAILSDPRMELRVDPESEDLPAPSCETAAGRAVPPVRLVQFARDLTPNSSVVSICRSDFRPAGAAIAELIIERPCE